MTKEDFKELTEKIIKGINLSLERLIEQKKKEDGYLLFSRNGKIEKVRAKEL